MYDADRTRSSALIFQCDLGLVHTCTIPAAGIYIILDWGSTHPYKIVTTKRIIHILQMKTSSGQRGETCWLLDPRPTKRRVGSH